MELLSIFFNQPRPSVILVRVSPYGPIVNLLQPVSTQCYVAPVCVIKELLSTTLNLPQPSMVLVQSVFS